MEVDVARAGWPARAACRWAVYVALHVSAFVLCLLASGHIALRVGGALLGLALALSLPLGSATLFEAAFGRQARQDLPVLCCPVLGACLVIIGIFALQQGSPLAMWIWSTEYTGSVQELRQRFGGMHLNELPRSVCMQHAFVKTDWEAGKLECHEADGHIACQPEFVAAPIFNDKIAADSSLPKDICAWAVTHGSHVIVTYQRDGTLCGYLQGEFELDFHRSNYRLAIRRVIEKYELSFDEHSDIRKPEADTAVVPVEGRPILMVADVDKMAFEEVVWLVVAVILLCGCPCVGPLPLGIVLAFWYSSSGGAYGGRHPVSPEDSRWDDPADAGMC
eukprot:TRINITY_DN49299_c0_g1_i1.p1 TRINITY_DN49299_c0_g1~~TRINITY_DN49299_c0_g1_i1.p1  ORF type:complete len:334 (-),score=27.75 TRINITY_DN49299_c0_g1_i1:72-1073(-)